jgi:hypothetical protein
MARSQTRSQTEQEGPYFSPSVGLADRGRPNDAEQWAKWAKDHQNARLFIHYLHSTKDHSEDLKDKHCPNVFVQKSSAQNHCVVPREHWMERTRASAVPRGKVRASSVISARCGDCLDYVRCLRPEERVLRVKSQLSIFS